LVLVIGLSWLWVATAIGGDVNFTGGTQDSDNSNSSSGSNPPRGGARKGGNNASNGSG
jgi:hypothetical protein